MPDLYEFWPRIVFKKQLHETSPTEVGFANSQTPDFTALRLHPIGLCSVETLRRESGDSSIVSRLWKLVKNLHFWGLEALSAPHNPLSPAHLLCAEYSPSYLSPGLIQFMGCEQVGWNVTGFGLVNWRINLNGYFHGEGGRGTYSLGWYKSKSMLVLRTNILPTRDQFLRDWLVSDVINGRGYQKNTPEKSFQDLSLSFFTQTMFPTGCLTECLADSLRIYVTPWLFNIAMQTGSSSSMVYDHLPLKNDYIPYSCVK